MNLEDFYRIDAENTRDRVARQQHIMAHTTGLPPYTEEDLRNPARARPTIIEGGTIFQLAGTNTGVHIAPEGSHVWWNFEWNFEWEPFPAGEQFRPGVWYATPNSAPCPIPLNPAKP